MEAHHLIKGKNAEKVACEHLEQCGLRLVTSNYQCRYGEIDLIMLHENHLVFVEVRSRNNTRHGSGAESVTFHKQRKITRTAQHFLQYNKGFSQSPCRFDVVSLTDNSLNTASYLDKDTSDLDKNADTHASQTSSIEWICDAFYAQ